MGITNLMKFIRKEHVEPQEINSDKPEVITDIELQFHLEIYQIMQEKKNQTLNPTPNSACDISFR